VDRPGDLETLYQADYRIARSDWGTLMLKPLVDEMTAKDAQQLMGIGTDRFLVSWLDVT
jgi:hypothetical protein